MVHISIRSLANHFGRVPVLRGIDLDIAAGELFFLLGPSGSGKTTLLRLIAGLCDSSAGSIQFDGKDVSRLPAHRRGAAMMFQNYALWPHLNVAQNIAFGLEERARPRDEIEQRVAEILRMVQLEGMGARSISQLSGGQQQRVALARALVVRPRCLLLDEPLSNLDTPLRHGMRTEIRRLCKEFGLTAIYVTHDRDEALSVADRVAVMDSGRIAQAGTPYDIYRNPATRMVAEFLGHTNVFEGQVQGLSSREGFYGVQTAFGVIHGRPYDPDWLPQRSEPVYLSVRPEAFSFGHVLGLANQFPGHIVDAAFLGASAQYIVQVSEGLLIKVAESNPRQIRQPSAEHVRAMASAADVVILRA